MREDSAIKFCKDIFDYYSLYNRLWKLPMKEGKRSGSASGQYAEEIIRNLLLNYINNKDIKFISGLMHNEQNMSPQVDLIICKPLRSEDAFLESNGFINIKRVVGIIEIKSLASRGWGEIENNIKQVRNIKASVEHDDLPSAILWLYFCGSHEEVLNIIDLCKQNKIVCGIVGRLLTNKEQKRLKNNNDRNIYISETDNLTLNLNVEGTVEKFLSWFVNICNMHK